MSQTKAQLISDLVQALAFVGTSSAPTNGMYLSAANTIAISTNSTERVEFGTSEVVFNDGGENYDFRIEGDTNSSLFFVDASTDRVGIGTTSPGRELEVYNDAAQAAIAITASTSGQSSLYFADTADSNIGAISYTHSDDALSFRVNDGERARIDSSGRLLVGTSTSTNNVRLGQKAAFVSTGGVYNGVSLTSYAGTGAGTSNLLDFQRSRGTSDGSLTIVASGDALGYISWRGSDGSAFVNAASISCDVDGTPGANDMPGRLVFSTTADGASSPTARMTIRENGQVEMPDVYNFTSTSAANVFINSSGYLRRSTSSLKYKTNVETLEDSYADAILNCRPVWYRSTTGNDDPDWGWWGFIAEEVAAIDPRLVHWKTFEVTYDENGSAVKSPCDPEPEGVQYDRFVPHLLNLIKRQKEQIEAMEARLTALEQS